MDPISAGIEAAMLPARFSNVQRSGASALAGVSVGQTSTFTREPTVSLGVAWREDRCALGSTFGVSARRLVIEIARAPCLRHLFKYERGAGGAHTVHALFSFNKQLNTLK